MKVYLDTTVLGVRVFGPFSEKERERYPDVQSLFAKIDGGEIDAAVSFYALQELHALCAELDADAGFENTVREVLLEILHHRVDILPLLTREERMLYRRRFTIQDASDEPHVICSLVGGCDTIVTYDSHFEEVQGLLTIYTPRQALDALPDRHSRG